MQHHCCGVWQDKYERPGDNDDPPDRIVTTRAEVERLVRSAFRAGQDRMWNDNLGGSCVVPDEDEWTQQALTQLGKA